MQLFRRSPLFLPVRGNSAYIAQSGSGQKAEQHITGSFNNVQYRTDG